MVWEKRKKGMWGKKQLATDLGQRVHDHGRDTLPVLPHTTFMVVIHRVPNGNNDYTSSNPLQASYADLRLWEELIAFIENNCDLQELYYLTAIYTSTLK